MMLQTLTLHFLPHWFDDDTKRLEQRLDGIKENARYLPGMNTFVRVAEDTLETVQSYHAATGRKLYYRRKVYENEHELLKQQTTPTDTYELIVHYRDDDVTIQYVRNDTDYELSPHLIPMGDVDNTLSNLERFLEQYQPE